MALAATGTFFERAQLFQPADSASFGITCAISSDTAMVGYSNTSTGAVDTAVYALDAGVWLPSQTLTNTDGVIPQDIQGDVAIAAAQNMVTGFAGVHVYTREAGTWSRLQTLEIPNLDDDTISVMGAVISPDGEWLAVGVFNSTLFTTNRGYVRMYQWGGSSFAFSSEIDSPEGSGFFSAFGQALALSETGTLLVGAYLSDAFGSGDGQAYVYKVSGTTWSLDQTINTPLNLSNTGFGRTVDITPDGASVLIGDAKNAASIYTNGGSSYSYVDRVDGLNANGDTLSRISADGLTVIHTDGGFDETSTIRVYENTGGWALTQTITPEHTDEVYTWKSVEWLDYAGGNIIASVFPRESGDGLLMEPGEVFIYSRDEVTDSPFSDFWTGFTLSEEREASCG